MGTKDKRESEKKYEKVRKGRRGKGKDETR